MSKFSMHRIINFKPNGDTFNYEVEFNDKDTVFLINKKDIFDDDDDINKLFNDDIIKKLLIFLPKMFPDYRDQIHKALIKIIINEKARKHLTALTKKEDKFNILKMLRKLNDDYLYSLYLYHLVLVNLKSVDEYTNIYNEIQEIHIPKFEFPITYHTNEFCSYLQNIISEYDKIYNQQDSEKSYFCFSLIFFPSIFYKTNNNFKIDLKPKDCEYFNIFQTCLMKRVSQDPNCLTSFLPEAIDKFSIPHFFGDVFKAGDNSNEKYDSLLNDEEVKPYIIPFVDEIDPIIFHSQFFRFALHYFIDKSKNEADLPIENPFVLANRWSTIFLSFNEMNLSEFSLSDPIFDILSNMIKEFSKKNNAPFDDEYQDKLFNFIIDNSINYMSEDKLSILAKASNNKYQSDLNYKLLIKSYIEWTYKYIGFVDLFEKFKKINADQKLDDNECESLKELFNKSPDYDYGITDINGIKKYIPCEILPSTIIGCFCDFLKKRPFIFSIVLSKKLEDLEVGDDFIKKIIEIFNHLKAADYYKIWNDINSGNQSNNSNSK